MNEATGSRVVGQKERTPAEAKADVLKSIEDQGIKAGDKGDKVIVVVSGEERPIKGKLMRTEARTKRGEGIDVGGRVYLYSYIKSIAKDAQ